MKFELRMPEAQMTDDMKLSTTWGIIRGYEDKVKAQADRIKALEAENAILTDELKQATVEEQEDADRIAKLEAALREADRLCDFSHSRDEIRAVIREALAAS